MKCTIIKGLTHFEIYSKTLITLKLLFLLILCSLPLKFYHHMIGKKYTISWLNLCTFLSIFNFAVWAYSKRSKVICFGIYFPIRRPFLSDKMAYVSTLGQSFNTEARLEFPILSFPGCLILDFFYISNSDFELSLTLKREMATIEDHVIISGKFIM